jgi:pilus assembly protein Flp/PilA
MLAQVHLFDDEEGQALVEYALILLLVAIVCVSALNALGTEVSGVLSKIGSDL